MSASEVALYDDMTDRCKILFIGYPNYAYQNNAVELIVHEPEEIESLMNSHKLNNIINNKNINNELLKAGA